MCTLPNKQSMSNASYYNRRASLWVPVDIAFVPRFPSNRRFFQRIFACEHLFAGHRCKCARKTIRGTQRGFPPEFTENPFQAIQSIFRPLEMHSKWRYKICMRSINDSFRNYNGLSIIFPKTLDASQRLTKEKKIHLIPISITFLNPKILGFLFPKKNSLTWSVKYFRKSQGINIRYKLRKLYMNIYIKRSSRNF